MAHDWTSSTSVIVMDDIDLVGVHAAWDDFLAEGGAVPREAPCALGRYKHGIGQVRLSKAVSVLARWCLTPSKPAVAAH